MDWQNWAQRKVSKGPAPVQQGGHVPQALGTSNGPPGAPPPGYAWTLHAGAGWVLVSLGGSAPAQAGAPVWAQPQTPFQAPMTPPQLMPPGPGAQVIPIRPSAPIESCTLVKSSGSDEYARMMAQVPDLVPPTVYDAMAGNMSPSSIAELATAGVPLAHDMPVAFSSAAHMPQPKALGLGGK